MSELERRLVAALTVVWIVSVPILFLLYRNLEPSPDQSIFDYIAWLALQGYPPYLESFEINWPGQIFIHMAAQALFGHASSAIRSFDYLIMQCATLAAAALLWRSGFRLGPALLLMIYPTLYVTSGHWMAGQRDIMAAELLLIACLLLAEPKRRSILLSLAGALMVFAIAIRPTYLAFLCGTLLLEAVLPVRLSGHSDRWQRVGAISVGAIALLAALVGIGSASGTLNPWYQNAIQYALDCYGSEPSVNSMMHVAITFFFNYWSWISVFAICGALCWALRTDAMRYPLLLVVGVLATCILSYIAQRKGFGYHLGGALPVLAILLSVFADTSARAINADATAGWIGRWSALPGKIWMLLLAAILLISTVGTFTKLIKSVEPANGLLPVAMQNSEQDSCEGAVTAERAASFIAKAVPASATVLPINCGYRAAFLARRLPASRYATSPAFGGSKHRCAIGDQFLNVYAADIRGRQPALILVSAAAFDGSREDLVPLAGAHASATRAAAVATNYRQVARFGSMLVYAPTEGR